MAKKLPSRRERQNAVISLFTFPAAIVGFYLLMNGIIEIVGLIIILFISLIIGSWAARYVPDMRKKENKNKNPYTGLPQKTAEKKPAKTSSSQKRTSQASSSQTTGKYNVRPDDVIIQLPLEELEGLEFEQLVYLYLKATGWKPIKTPETKDGGVDIVVINKTDGLKTAVQVKHYYRSKTQVTVKDIRELDSAKKNHHCIGTWFITSGTFTNAALVEADTRRMKTSDVTFVETKIIPWKEREAAKRQVAVAKK
ncbi:restriction endonuclease [Anoxybacillus sp. LAT_35]|uniref:restriction endonuclease n=1 Tax=unclassified Anoxybacillus TaxID=2639704 RepID=UPI001EDBD629|nr:MULTISPECIES: restriction endonuclease [unclassified Anoxybacillus]MCG5024646.1 restriction endonuclease [Anoxybacillus flavithermus]MCG6198048.1 restriction endonuclease [Anoxybacillus sp. LAT_38]MCG3085911.1 restriction endonuclease [Anoxybacillus sp. LAT27]MCG6172706.1 restriction endonuclease [Anoxybacillus sp. LAT_11]MCG6173342.1 restriction endonuclease [Anoxybacillus sp. LAT_11]